MPTPFPGMDPYLEAPDLWPDVHTRLITALADSLVPRVAPRYVVGVEVRTYAIEAEDLAFLGVADVAVRGDEPPHAPARAAATRAGALTVEVPRKRQPRVPQHERYLVVRQRESRRVVTVLELLSPANKEAGKGRRIYERKRERVFTSRTSLVEVDLLRAGEPMPLLGPPVASAYRVLVSRGWERPQADLYAFGVRQPVPIVPVPLLAEDDEPLLDINTILHEVYDRARYDLRVDYNKPAAPPLDEGDAAWARAVVMA